MKRVMVNQEKELFEKNNQQFSDSHVWYLRFENIFYEYVRLSHEGLHQKFDWNCVPNEKIMCFPICFPKCCTHARTGQSLTCKNYYVARTFPLLAHDQYAKYLVNRVCDNYYFFRRVFQVFCCRAIAIYILQIDSRCAMPRHQISWFRCGENKIVICWFMNLKNETKK